MKRVFTAFALAAVCGLAMAQAAHSVDRSVTIMSPAVSAFIAQEKDALSTALFDPSTAQYRHLMVYSHPTSDGPGYCLMGEVNAKNVYGGYVGFNQFVNDIVAPSDQLDADNAGSALAYTQESAACMQGGKLVYIQTN